MEQVVLHSRSYGDVWLALVTFSLPSDWKMRTLKCACKGSRCRHFIAREWFQLIGVARLGLIIREVPNWADVGTIRTPSYVLVADGLFTWTLNLRHR